MGRAFRLVGWIYRVEKTIIYGRFFLIYKNLLILSVVAYVIVLDKLYYILGKYVLTIARGMCKANRAN